MPETLVAFAVLVLLAFVAAVFGLIPPETLIAVGLVVIAAGLVLAVPAGVWYHLTLHRALRAGGPVPPRWWLRPNAYHDRVPVARRDPVLLWFRLGAASFLVILFGSALAMLGGLRR